MSDSLRRPMGEVTQEFADGGYYIKSLLDTTAREILNAEFKKQAELESAKKAEEEKKGEVVKEEEVKFVMDEFELTHSESERKLKEEGGDLSRTLRVLVGLPKEESSS